MQQELEERFILDSVLWKEALELIEMASAEERERCVNLVLYGDYHEYPADPKQDEEAQTRVMMAALLNDEKQRPPEL